jgi:hypothetical protein
MKPGIYANIPFDEYLKIEAINKSGLEWFQWSPLHYWTNCLSPNKPEQKTSDAMALGTAIHMAILEPERFAATYIASPRFDRRTKQGKQDSDGFRADCERRGLTDIDEQDFETCKRVRDSVRATSAAEIILETGSSEVTMVWEDPIEGVLCKGRLDWLSAVILDFKSTIDARHSAFSKQVANMGWHIQAAFYTDGYRAITKIEPPFIFGAIEKSAPFGCAFYELGSEEVDAGRKLYRKWLAQYAKCLGNKTWPGYPSEIKKLNLPAWAMKETQDGSTELEF